MKKIIFGVSAVMLIAVGTIIATNYSTSSQTNTCCSASSECCYL